MKWKKDTKQNKPAGSSEGECEHAENVSKEEKRGEENRPIGSEKVLVKREEEA